MDDYALVLNAGSSSLKFCVFQRPPGESWRLEARGQIEGIGTSPRLSVKDANGESLANQDVAVRDGREALMRSLGGCDRDMAARVCSVLVIAWSMAVRVSRARQS